MNTNENTCKSPLLIGPKFLNIFQLLNKAINMCSSNDDFTIHRCSTTATTPRFLVESFPFQFQYTIHGYAPIVVNFLDTELLDSPFNFSISLTVNPSVCKVFISFWSKSPIKSLYKRFK